MTKSFKKAIACMLAVLMAAFAAPLSAFAYDVNDVSSYHPDAELQFSTFFNTSVASFATEDLENDASATWDYSGLYSPPIDATYTKNTTDGSIEVTKLTRKAAKTHDFIDFYNKFQEVESGDDGFFDYPDADYDLTTGDYFVATVRMDNMVDTSFASFAISYSDNIEPAGAFSYKPKKLLYAVGTVSECKELDTKGNASWQYGGELPAENSSASGLYGGALDSQEDSNARTYTCTDGVTKRNRMLITLNSTSGYNVNCANTASPDTDFSFVNPETGALDYVYTDSIVCASFVFKITGDFDASHPIVYGVYDKVNSEDEEFGGGHEGASQTCVDAKPKNYATYALEPQSPASGQFTFFGMNVNTGEGCDDTPVQTTHTVTYVDAEGATISTETVNDGAAPANVPTLPANSGHDSYAWDGDVTAAITADTTFTIVKTTSAHTYESVVTNPTCTEGGYTTYTCSICGDTYTADATEALGHDYQAVVTAPTCTEGGYTTYTCSRCQDSYTADATEALGHDFGEWVEVTPATEEAAGLKRRDCSRCDAYEEEEIPKLDHTHIPGEAQEENRVEPSCTEAGSYDLVVRCTACGEIISSTPQTIPALGHDFGNWYEATPATCTEAGVSRRDCSRCEEFETQPIAALGHDYQAVVTEPTCTEAGYTTYTCSRCQDSYVADETTALGHAWGDWVVTKEATKSAEGEKQRTCSRCNEVETEAIPALKINITVAGSDYGTVSGDFNVTNADVTQQYNFGQSYTFTATAKEGYIFQGWKIGGKQASTAATYTSKAYADVTIEAVYSKAEESTFTVRFYDLYKNIVKEQDVTSAAEIEAPTDGSMARSGFVFKGWDKDLDSITSATEVNGVYEPDTATGYTVTVAGTDNAKIDGAAATEKSGIPYDSKCTVYAEGATGWKIGDTVVSTSDTYTFYVGSDVTVTAVYDDVEAVPAITIVNVKPIAGSDYKYQFIATRVVPAGYKVEKVGFVYGKNLEDSELTLDKVGAQGTRDNAGKIKAGYNNVGDCLETSLSYGLTKKDGDIKAKAFMVVSKGGKQEVIYSAINGYNYATGQYIKAGISDIDDND